MMRSTSRRGARGERLEPGTGELVGALHVLEHLLELRAVELLDGPLVLLHRPAPEVEVDVGDPVLDRAPERPAVLRHQAPRASPRDLVAKRPAVVVGDELLELPQ